jgi:hypothetical protein
MKISARGRLLWVKKRSMPTSSPGERAWDVAVDSSGNAYCSGRLVKKGVATFAVVKYTPAGRVSWARTRAMQGEDYGEARAIALDASGHVYAAGEFSLSGGSAQFAETVRYSPTGHLDWHGEYRAYEDSLDSLHSIAVSKAGVAAAGYSGHEMQVEGLTLVYGPRGKLKIHSVAPAWPGGTGVHWETVAINATGQVAVGGYLSATAGRSYFAMGTIGGPIGSEIRVLDHTVVNSSTGICRAVAIAPGGRIYGTGSFSDGVRHPLYTQSWDQVLPNWTADYGTQSDGLAILLTPGGVVVTGSDGGNLVLADYAR